MSNAWPSRARKPQPVRAELSQPGPPGAQLALIFFQNGVNTVLSVDCPSMINIYSLTAVNTLICTICIFRRLDIYLWNQAIFYRVWIYSGNKIFIELVTNILNFRIQYLSTWTNDKLCMYYLPIYLPTYLREEYGDRVVFVYVSDDMSWGQEKIATRVRGGDFYLAGALGDSTLR